MVDTMMLGSLGEKDCGCCRTLRAVFEPDVQLLLGFVGGGVLFYVAVLGRKGR